MANGIGGVITTVLLDLSSVVVGHLDTNSLTQKLTSCNEVGKDHKFKCGFIFDFRICKERISVLGQAHFPKFTRIFINLRQDNYDNLLATNVRSEVRKCIDAIIRSGFKLGGVLDENKIILNSTYFEIQMPTPNRDTSRSERILASTLQQDVSNSTCHSGNQIYYSNNSMNESTSAVISISSHDLYTALTQDLYVRDNGPYLDYSFRQLFCRFLVIFPSIEYTDESPYVKNGSSVSIPALLEKILRYGETQKETYYLRPLQLWNAFTPKEVGWRCIRLTSKLA